MFVFIGPRWLLRLVRPGGNGARALWLVTLAVAIAMAVFAWTEFSGTRGKGGSAVLFLVLWTAVLVGITAWNFRTLWLGQGRRAQAMKRAADEYEAEHATGA